MADSVPARRPSPLRAALAAPLVLLALSALAVPGVAADSCAEAPADLSVRPKELTSQPKQAVSAHVGDAGTPYQETGCDSGCPGQPAIVAWADPANGGSADDVGHYEGCSATAPEDRDGDLLVAFYRYAVVAGVDGSFTPYVALVGVDEEPYTITLPFDEE